MGVGGLRVFFVFSEGGGVGRGCGWYGGGEEEVKVMEGWSVVECWALWVEGVLYFFKGWRSMMVE